MLQSWRGRLLLLSLIGLLGTSVVSLSTGRVLLSSRADSSRHLSLIRYSTSPSSIRRILTSLALTPKGTHTIRHLFKNRYRAATMRYCVIVTTALRLLVKTIINTESVMDPWTAAMYPWTLESRDRKGLANLREGTDYLVSRTASATWSPGILFNTFDASEKRVSLESYRAPAAI